MTYYERNLPHWHPPGAQLFLTWRLYGSLPASYAELLRKQTPVNARTRFARAERFLDGATRGPLWLAEPTVGEVVEQCIVHGDSALGFYTLNAFVIMPNHVHLLIEPRIPMKRITAGIKGVSAKAANKLLGRVGETFWQAESFDHWIRNSAEGAKTRTYIERNPVKAGLVTSAELWPWSSASSTDNPVCAVLPRRR